MGSPRNPPAQTLSISRLPSMESHEINQSRNMRPCACGCGTLVPLFDKRRRPRSYVLGHGTKGKISLKPSKLRGRIIGPRTDTPTLRTSRSRARRWTNTAGCRLSFLCHCKGLIDVAHIDQNPLNNEPANRWPLCRSHHRLVDNGKIDVMAPVMPSFYTDRSGKRRYKRTKGGE